jgi:hypothetical protein
VGKGETDGRRRSDIVSRADRRMDLQGGLDTAAGKRRATGRGLQAYMAPRLVAGLMLCAVPGVKRLGEHQYGDQDESCGQRSEHGGSITGKGEGV